MGKLPTEAPVFLPARSYNGCWLCTSVRSAYAMGMSQSLIKSL